MNFNKLLPKVVKNKSENEFNNMLYLFLTEFGWTWEQFVNTPIPVVLRILRTHKKKNKKNGKQY